MTMQQRLRAKLEAALAPVRLEVINESELHAGHRSSPGTGESHFRIIVVSPAFDGVGRLERHRKINQLVADELRQPGGVHALAVHAYAPGEPERH
ncbi:MAG: BolA family protein [Hyphomicrobiaceae bacterium]